MIKQSKKRKKDKVSYHKKPEELSLEQWQTELRRQFIRDGHQKFSIKFLGQEGSVFGDYLVYNSISKNEYKVALRGNEPGQNFCSCMDFKTNGLGTCKHIEFVLLKISKNKQIAKFLKQEYTAPYSSLYIKYGQERQVCLRVGTEKRAQFLKLAKLFFNQNLELLPEAASKIEIFLAKAKRISLNFRCYDDALEFVLKLRDDSKRAEKINNLPKKYFDDLLKTSLYIYQKQGIIFAARAGRALIADEMGLGKTLQAIGLSELYKKEFGIASVLIICPTSLKYQWKSEIEKFSNNSICVIEGDALTRQKQYSQDSFFKIISYNIVSTDLEYINKQNFDLVILDEAQRIKNWQTKTAKEVKKIQSKYALVLTGTPLENKLEELYSIVQFIDPFKLGPLYKFLRAHQILGENGKVIGYQNLNQIQKLLADIVIRRSKKQVMAQLPERVDKHLFVPLTEHQAKIHSEYSDIVAKLVNKWKRFGFLDEKDRQRLLLALNCMRMVACSTFILDQETRHDTKIAELMAILENFFTGGTEKAVIFCQWERMTRLVKQELEIRKIGFAYLHGGVLSKNRKVLLDAFHSQPKCRIFLSTDSGGVGLNLQNASLVINLDIPWNPAVLEQRIGRVHRHGQKQKVNVINLVSKDSIEERMLEILKFKTSLFSGVLDNGADEIFMGEDKFKKFMSSVESVVSSSAAPLVVNLEATQDKARTKKTSPAVAETKLNIQQQSSLPSASPHPPEPVLTTADFFTAATGFINQLAQTLGDNQKREKLVSSLVAKDAASGKTYLKIPIENQETVNKTIDAITNFLSIFKT